MQGVLGYQFKIRGALWQRPAMTEGHPSRDAYHDRHQ